MIRVIGTLADVTEQKTAQERLLHDAVHDNLTGLPNRELFFDRLDAALKLSQTDAQIRPTVICIDIDRFKQINETIGFSAGRFDPADDRAPARPYPASRRIRWRGCRAISSPPW